VLAETDNNNTPTRLNVWGANGIVSTGAAGASSRYYALNDSEGSVRFLTDSTGAVVSLYKYTPYGVASTTIGGSTSGVSTSTPAYVQGGMNSSTGSVSFPGSVTTGNTVIVGVTIWNTAVPSNDITDNKGNTYIKIGETIHADSTDHAALFYAKNVTGGSSFTVTSSVGGTIAIHEYSGLSTTTPLDKVASSTGFSNVPYSGNITTATSSELYFGLAWSGGDGDSWTAGPGYTKRQEETNNNTAERIATEDKVIISTTTTSASFTTSSSADWIGIIATFKPAVNTTSGSATSPYQYAGENIDDETGLTYLRARYYDPSTGRFISRDSQSGDLQNPLSQNPYIYGEDNPVTYTDPSGQAVLVAGGAAAGSFLGPVGTVCGIIVGSALTIIIGGTIIDNIISNLNLSSSGANKGTSKPVDAPSGTKPIDQVGLPRDLIHEIKGDIGARPNDWTGVTPDGDVITAGPDGKTVNHGPVEAWQ
jgi:RHS repeat-associated protein